MQNDSKQIIESFWGGGDFNWVARDAIGLFGGMLIVWNSDLVVAIFSFTGVGFVGVCAKNKNSNSVCFLVNVYSPWSLNEKKKELWRDIVLCKRCFGGDQWCVAGDFNATVRASERKGGLEAYERREFADFCQFIYEMDLIDIPVLGKKFCWFSGDGRVKSRLDRLLLTEELISSWQVTAQWIGNRDNSDHCPIWIDSLTLDWGPKPFRFNNCWLGHKDFKVFVEDCWKSFNVRGWKMFAFKEKLKLLREKLREWNKDIFC